MQGKDYMSLVRFSPLSRALSQWPDLWDDDFIGASMPTYTNNLDVYETEDDVVVKANVAGVSEDNIDLTFEKGVLWIKAEANQEDTNDNKKHYSKSNWSYSYKIAVPGMLDFSVEPDAKVKDGIVSITFKKSAATKPRKLTIKKS